MSSEQQNERLARPLSRRQLLKSSAVTGGLVVGVTSGVSSCSLSWDHGFTPKISNWIQQLASGVGAELIADVVKKGLKKAWSEWRPHVSGSLGQILAAGVEDEAYIYGGRSQSQGGSITTDAFMSTGATRMYVPGDVGYGHPVPPVILVQVAETPEGNPATDHLVAFVTTGKQHVVLQPWAWQTMLSFVHSLTSGQSGANLDIAKAGCALSLLPSAVRPKTGQSPEGTVDWVTYQTRNGWVEISRVQSSNSSATGVITASAILDSSTGQPLNSSFPLPS